METGVPEPTSLSRVTLQGCRALREEACAWHWPLGVSRKFHLNRELTALWDNPSTSVCEHLLCAGSPGAPTTCQEASAHGALNSVVTWG